MAGDQETHVVSTDYDLAGRPVAVSATDPADPETPFTTTYVHDKGRLAARTDPGGTVALAYHPAGLPPTPVDIKLIEKGNAWRAELMQQPPALFSPQKAFPELFDPRQEQKVYEAVDSIWREYAGLF